MGSEQTKTRLLSRIEGLVDGIAGFRIAEKKAQDGKLLSETVIGFF